MANGNTAGARVVRTASVSCLYLAHLNAVNWCADCLPHIDLDRFRVRIGIVCSGFVYNLFTICLPGGRAKSYLSGVCEGIKEDGIIREPGQLWLMCLCQAPCADNVNSLFVLVLAIY